MILVVDDEEQVRQTLAAVADVFDALVANVEEVVAIQEQYRDE